MQVKSNQSNSNQSKSKANANNISKPTEDQGLSIEAPKLEITTTSAKSVVRGGAGVNPVQNKTSNRFRRQPIQQHKKNDFSAVQMMLKDKEMTKSTQLKAKNEQPIQEKIGNKNKNANTKLPLQRKSIIGSNQQKSNFSTLQMMLKGSNRSQPVQLKVRNKQLIQKKGGENKTGMPDGVKNKMESAFNTDFSGVNIVRNSPDAGRVGALAYTQGTDIHFAKGQYDPSSKPGQELLGHELTHVVQQAKGIVKPTTQAGGMPVNDDKGLEREADVMGKKAASFNDKTPVQNKLEDTLVPPVAIESNETAAFTVNPVQEKRRRRRRKKRRSRKRRSRKRGRKKKRGGRRRKRKRGRGRKKRGRGRKGRRGKGRSRKGRKKRGKSKRGKKKKGGFFSKAKGLFNKAKSALTGGEEGGGLMSKLGGMASNLLGGDDDEDGGGGLMSKLGGMASNLLGGDDDDEDGGGGLLSKIGGIASSAMNGDIMGALSGGASMFDQATGGTMGSDLMGMAQQGMGVVNSAMDGDMMGALSGGASMFDQVTGGTMGADAMGMAQQGMGVYNSAMNGDMMGAMSGGAGMFDQITGGTMGADAMGMAQQGMGVYNSAMSGDMMGAMSGGAGMFDQMTGGSMGADAMGMMGSGMNMMSGFGDMGSMMMKKGKVVQRSNNSQEQSNSKEQSKSKDSTNEIFDNLYNI